MSYKVVYNAKYGDFGLSKEALAEYNRLTSRRVEHAECIERDDPILIHLVETMIHTVDNEYSRLKIKEFPIKYKSFLQWHEYDGLETIFIDYHQYLIDRIKYVLDDTHLSSNEKIERIQELYIEYHARPRSVLNKNIDTIC
jgi:hypothetical protein